MTDTINRVRPIDVCDRYLKIESVWSWDSGFLVHLEYEYLIGKNPFKFTTIQTDRKYLDFNELIRYMTSPFPYKIREILIVHPGSCKFMLNHIISKLVLSPHYRKLFGITI